MKIRNNISIPAKEYNFRQCDVVGIYYKQNKWRIYSGGTYRLHKTSKPFSKSINELIEEICSEKNVKKEKVKIARVKNLEMEII